MTGDLQMRDEYGAGCVIADSAVIGQNVHIGHNCIIEENAVIGDDCYIDSNTIIRADVTLGAGGRVGANCILGEHCMDFWLDRKRHVHPLTIGENALIRSGSILYAGSEIGRDFQTGHQVTIREQSKIGDHVSIGTRTDIQGSCKIGNYVRFQSMALVAQETVIDDYVWIFPYVAIVNDPTPPSEHMLGAHIRSFAILCTGATVLPGMEVAHDALVGVGAVVTKPVAPYAVVVGSPARRISDVREIKSKVTGEPIYPWRQHFDRAMPWEGVGFDAWYASLEDGEQRRLADLLKE